MKIILTRVGGILPVKKIAEADVDWSDEDCKAIEEMSTKPVDASARDGMNYLLSYNEKTFSFDWEKVPAKYKQTLEQLKNNLQVKPF